jgi:hypothetical protein
MDKLKRDRIWAVVKKKYRLSREVVNMAQELGLNPKKIGSIANHKQEPWKSPLPEFIKDLHRKRFKRE